MSKVVLECKHLNKEMNKRIVVSDVSFDLYEKDILAFIGPNGAGKTSIIKLILGLYKKTSGKVIINEYDLDCKFVHAISNVGAIIENPDLYSYMSGYENLMISAKIYNISKERVFEVVKLVGLEESINELVSKYSLGMKQRLGIAQAILHEPKVLILDEPINGLDPQGILELNELLKKLAKNGMAIIISSHILSELESLCNKFCFIKGGRIVAYNERAKIKEEDSYIIELSNCNLKNVLRKYIMIDSCHIKINTKKDKINKIIKKIINAKIKIYEIKKESSSLEKMYLEVMSEKLYE